MRVIVVAALAAFAFSLPSHAQMHMCKDAQGRKTFSDAPCGNDDTIVNVNPASGGTGINPGANVRTEYYEVRGTTLDELVREITTKGPEGGWSGNTTSRLSYHVSWLQTKNGCRIEKAEANYDAKVLLPNWANRFAGTPQLQTQWDGIYRSLDLHERGHVRITLQGAQELERALRSIGEQPSCDVIKAMVKDRSQQVWSDNEQAQRAYDLETDHGRKQWTPYR